MPTAVFISPHLDDAVFSAGGTLARRLRDGVDCRMATVFTRSVPNPTGFALACQRDKGLPDDADYMALRRAEDHTAAAALGLPADRVVHLDLPEAPHRGYGSAAELFASVRADDANVVDAVAAALRPLLDADEVFLPRGLGRHVDHLQVIAAVDRALAARPAAVRPAVWRWADTPYALREDPAVATAGEAVDVSATLPAKLNACAAYTTQVGFQFGDADTLRRRLTAFAERSGGERFVRDPA